MKKNFASQSFAVLTAALMMVSSVACSTTPIQEEAPITESSAPVAADSSLDSSMAEAPMTEESTQDTYSGTTQDPMSAPSSLGASSSGRGH